jgi:transposase
MVKKQEIIIRHYRNGDSERKISRELNISRTTVRRYLEEYRKARESLSTSNQPNEALIEDLVKAPCYNSYNRGKRKLTTEITNEVNNLLKLNEQKKNQGLHKQMLKKIDILEYLTEKGYDIGYTTICNYVSEKSHKTKEAYIRQVYQPGEVCEFDWGEVKLNIDGTKRTLNMAVFTPAMSNYRYAILFYRQDTASFQQSHVNFFEHIGGVYHTMVYDNMRVAIRKFVGPKEKEPTEALLKLSMYYHFGFRFCNARRGNEKGHVERSVEYVRRKAFSINDTFASVEEANQWLQKTCNRVNACYNRFTKGQRPLDLFNQEKDYLYPAPPRFDCANIEQCRADKYSTITYATNRYSVPDHLVGQIIDIKIYPEKIICYHQSNKICEHDRQYGRHGWYILMEHYLCTLQTKPGALAGSQALKSAPENVKSIYEKYFKDDARGFIELLQFVQNNKYDFTDIEKVINRLKDICPHDISIDKIKALCMQKQRPAQIKHDYKDPILLQSNKQLREYCTLFN